MDSRSLAMELAPVIMWRKEQKPESYRQYWSQAPRSPSKKNANAAPNYSAWDMLAGESCNDFYMTQT